MKRKKKTTTKTATKRKAAMKPKVAAKAKGATKAKTAAMKPKVAAKAKPTSHATQAVPRTRTVVLDHISLPVRDMKVGRAFYAAALGAIGMRINLDFSTAFGLGSRDENIFWLVHDRRASGGGHYAFRVDHREEVHAFHAAALAVGGKDHGKPGPRPNYGPRYYAAFVKDREDNNIEVVCYA